MADKKYYNTKFVAHVPRFLGYKVVSSDDEYINYDKIYTEQNDGINNNTLMIPIFHDVSEAYIRDLCTDMQVSLSEFDRQYESIKVVLESRDK